MANESGTFGLSVLVTVVGLAIMLYGVSLNSGQSLNTLMIVGGVIVLGSMSLLTAGLMRIDGGHAAE